MRTNMIRLSTACLLASLSMLSTPSPGAAAAAGDAELPRRCGFYLTPNDPEQTTARYQHCGDHHILIRIHWSNGVNYLSCEEPWSNSPFWADGIHVVTNAYYVPIPPRVVWTDDGRGYCAAHQPG